MSLQSNPSYIASPCFGPSGFEAGADAPFLWCRNSLWLDFLRDPCREIVDAKFPGGAVREG